MDIIFPQRGRDGVGLLLCRLLENCITRAHSDARHVICQTVRPSGTGVTVLCLVGLADTQDPLNVTGILHHLHRDLQYGFDQASLGLVGRAMAQQLYQNLCSLVEISVPGDGQKLQHLFPSLFGHLSTSTGCFFECETNQGELVQGGLLDAWHSTCNGLQLSPDQVSACSRQLYGSVPTQADATPPPELAPPSDPSWMDELYDVVTTNRWIQFLFLLAFLLWLYLAVWALDYSQPLQDHFNQLVHYDVKDCPEYQKHAYRGTL